MKQGWGLPSAKNLYDRRQKIRIVNQDRVLKELEEHVYTASVGPGETALRVTMTFMDRPGTTSSTVHRVNDVSLQVTDPTGTSKYFGNNGLTTGNWSVSGGTPDHVDTVENVFVPNPAPGTWTIRVTADDINADQHLETVEDDQDYALVVSGVGGLAFLGPALPGSVGERALTVAKSGSDILLSWKPDCGGGGSYAVYRGALASGYASAAPVPGACAVATTFVTVPAGGESSFYLVAPTNGSVEGTLGTTSAGAPRAQPASACLPRAAEPNACAQ
jgi:hypothetical protein